MPNYVPGYGPRDAKIMAIAEAPGAIENERGIPLVGPTGQLFDTMCSEIGLSSSSIYKTNVSKYQPPLNNDFSKLHLIGVDIQEQTRKLWEEEILKIRPNVILCLGNQALTAVTGLSGINKYRGSIIPSKDGQFKVVPTIHPAALFPKKNEDPLPWIYREIIRHDIERAFEESHTSQWNLPVRTHSIAYSSLDVHRFIQEYDKLDSASCDIESLKCIPSCVAFAFTRHHSLSIPLLPVLTDMGSRELAECWLMVQDILRRKKLIGQNFKYDHYKLNLIGFILNYILSDIKLKTHLIWPELPEKTLEMLTSLWTREPYYKDEGEVDSKGKIDVVKYLTYNGKDACVTKEIDEEQEDDLIALSDTYGIDLKKFFYSYVMRKHGFYLEMENHGFAIDFEKKEYLKNKYEGFRRAVHERLTELVGYEVNVKSYPQVGELLYKALKFPPRKIAPTSEDSIIALLGNHCKGKDGPQKAKILETVLEERRVRDQLSRAINFEPDYDKRCKTSFNIEQTETSRSSTNILKKPVRPKKIGLAFHTIPKHGRLAKDIRSMLVPDKGKVLISPDLSQAEARIVAVLSEDYELLKAFDQVDIHRRTAGLFFGLLKTLDLRPINIPLVDGMDKDGPERFTGKMFRHAGNYDMGKARAMNEFNVNAQKYEINASISEWKAGQYIDLFHEASPKIRAVFHQSVKNAIDHNKILINPFGRPRKFFGRWDDELYKEAYAYIPQSTVADVCQSGALDAWDEFGHGSDVVFFSSENHDALVIQAPENDWQRYALCLKRHMLRTIDFNLCTLKRNYVLTIPVDIEVSIDFKSGKITSYGELSKWKETA
jgi:uracil-DNA glycosylase family 4